MRAAIRNRVEKSETHKRVDETERKRSWGRKQDVEKEGEERKL